MQMEQYHLTSVCGSATPVQMEDRWRWVSILEALRGRREALPPASGLPPMSHQQRAAEEELLSDLLTLTLAVLRVAERSRALAGPTSSIPRRPCAIHLDLLFLGLNIVTPLALGVTPCPTV